MPEKDTVHLLAALYSLQPASHRMQTTSLTTEPDRRPTATPCAPWALLLAASLLLPGCGPRRKLLQWGWDEPDTTFLRANIREMERTPFDGCVFGVRYGPAGKSGSFTWQFWGRGRFTEEDLAAAFADLRAVQPRRFTENFLRVNVTPGDVDWFEDFSAIIANASLAAEMSRAGQARGIVLDVEQYQGRLFDYETSNAERHRSWAALAAQARRRGREIMAAFQRSYPGLTVFLTFGHSLPWVLSEQGRRPLSETPYGLLAPFLDGMLEVAEGCTRLVDGYELSYGFQRQEQFGEARAMVENAVLPIVGVPDAYRRRLQLAFGIWLDYDWKRRGWSFEDHSRNYFSPRHLESAVGFALHHSDEYVWVYAENPRWWGSEEPAMRTPAAYLSALRRARARFLRIPEHRERRFRPNVNIDSGHPER